MAPESLEMHGIPLIFMVLEVDGKGTAGFGIIRNAWDCHHFHDFGSGWEGDEWSQNHKKRPSLSAFSLFWKSAVRGAGWLGNHEKCIRL